MERLRVVVLGYVVRGPLGGLAWHHLHYVDGFAHLGHDVWFAEIGDSYPSCSVPALGTLVDDPGVGLAFASSAFARLGYATRWAYHDARTSLWTGPAAQAMPEVLATADLVINVSGSNDLRAGAECVPTRVFVDTDPVFTQARHLRDGAARGLAADHTAWFSFGERIERDATALPDDGLPWRATRQPISLARWPVTPGDPRACFTTVMQWESYPPVFIDGVEYGAKARSFPPFFDLPARTTAPLELAIGGATAPRAALARVGWRVTDSLEVTRDPWTFQRYVQQSAAELSIAKHAYVAHATGWFSERSANYLASGRPVITQDTGLGDSLPTGSGLLVFREAAEVVDAIDAVRRDYDAHCVAARELAEAHFAADRVLGDLLARL